jgi:sugar phosphate isomerase/epimerase
MGVQLFNYGNYISSGGRTGDPNPITGVSEACLTSTTTECRRERLEALFAFLRSKGVTAVELFGHATFPASDDIEGLQAYRALLDKYGLHAGGWHGSMNETQWAARVNAAKILGVDYIGSGGTPSPGIGSYQNTLATAQAMDRLGKYSVEQGVGPVYIHNHTGEFDARYEDGGEIKTAWQILMERTDPRYSGAEVDVFWSSDAFNDVTGTKTAELIEEWGDRILMLHIKDGVNVAGGTETNSRSGSPRATGTGEVDFRPIFEAAEGNVRYYHQEHDGGTIADADTSFTNLKGIDDRVVPAVGGKPQTFPSVPAGTPASMNAVPMTITNTGDAPLDVNQVQIASEGFGDQADFAVVSQDCTAADIAPKGTCTVHVGFQPTRTNYRSVSYLRINSNADNPTEYFLLTGMSTDQAHVAVGGVVPSTLSLSLGSAASFGLFLPGVTRTYETSLVATATSTADNAALSVFDGGPSVGHLANGSHPLPQPLEIRATNAANPAAPYTPLSAAMTLLSYAGPFGTDAPTIGFRQSIAATDALRSGAYGKTLTFTLSTTAP